MMFYKEWEKLDNKLRKLKQDLENAIGILGDYERSKWDSVFELCNEIKEDFRDVRYPKKEERDAAWQKFFNLRHRAFKERDAQREGHSKTFRRDIFNRLSGVEYDWVADFVVGQVLSLGLFKTRKEEMKYAGKELTEISRYFSAVKGEMTKEHKSEVFERIKSVRETHDQFWSRYKETSGAEYHRQKEERQKVWQAKQDAWQEKQEKSQRVRNSIEKNIDQNKEKLNKAQSALDRCYSNQRKLQDKIDEAYSDDYRSKHEEWLNELNEKIEDIETSIKRIESWIQEGESKLDNWN